MKLHRLAIASLIFVYPLLAAEPEVAEETIVLEPAQKAKATAKTPEKVEKNVVAIFEFRGPLTEGQSGFELGAGPQPRRSMYELLRRFKKAEQDKNLKAIVFMFEDPELGLAQMQEIGQAIGRLRAAGKDVYCYLETAKMGIYTFSTAATKIYATPVGDIEFTGIRMQQAYFKGLMDKLGLEADIEHVGAFKSAGEPFTQTGPSPEAQQMMEWLAKDIFEQMIETVANNRNIPIEQVRALVDQGPFTAKAAVAAGLIDEVAYAEEFGDFLKEEYEVDSFERDYGAKKGPDLDFSNIFSFFKSFGEIMAEGKPTGKPAIAIVYVDGMIVEGTTEDSLFGESNQAASTTLRRALARAANDDNIKAVVLRVDSPGGSALASDIIWYATKELQDRKSFVVSMGNVAASGGYYVSCASPTIFADQGTITGSIGVIGGKLVAKGLWDWLGVTFHETKIGENADLFSTDERFNDRQRALVKKLMKEVYDEFTDRIKQGRGERLKKDIDELAGGRVYTGRQALELGLVDKIGGLWDALQFAAGEENLDDYEIRLMPETKNFLDLLVESLSGQKNRENEGDIELLSSTRSWLAQTPVIREFLPALQKADPQRYRTVLRSLQRIELLSRARAVLVLPAEISIR